MTASASPLRCFHPGNLLTYASLLAALGAIACSGQRSPGLAGALIAVAVILDTFDGRFARLFARDEDQRAIGGQLDSLVDAVSFGVAPAMCMLLLRWRPASLRPASARSAGLHGFSRPIDGFSRPGSSLVGVGVRLRRVRRQQARVLQRFTRTNRRIHWTPRARGRPDLGDGPPAESRHRSIHRRLHSHRRGDGAATSDPSPTGSCLSPRSSAGRCLSSPCT